MRELPFVAIGADELKGPLKKGDKIHCKKCNKKHVVSLAKDKDGKESTIAMFYRCGEISYLAGLGGMAI